MWCSPLRQDPETRRSWTKCSVSEKVAEWGFKSKVSLPPKCIMVVSPSSPHQLLLLSPLPLPLIPFAVISFHGSAISPSPLCLGTHQPVLPLASQSLSTGQDVVPPKPSPVWGPTVACGTDHPTASHLASLPFQQEF